MSTSFDTRSVPKLAPGIELRQLPIGAREGFVLSRVDGRSTLGEVATLTGFPLDEVERIFARLVELRAAYFGDTPPALPTPAPPPAAAKPPPVRKRRPRKWADAELAAEADLDDALKAQILDLLHDPELDHYELLGVARDVDRKGIKSAYYQLAAKFHTDRYFGRNLGPFKSKMEQLFGRITQAHDTLANKGKRAEYDAYLVDLDRTRAFERYLSDEEPDAEEEPAPDPVIEPAPVIEPETEPAPEPSSFDPLRARREALAKRLAGVSSARPRVAPKVPAPAPSAPSAPPNAEQAQAATEALRRRYEEGRDHARKTQTQRMIDAAEAALAKDDLLGAANNYRLALRYSDEPELAAKYEEVNRRARDAMAETYLKQAKYEEQAGKWGAAGGSYAKAHEGRPEDADLCDLAARAFRMEGRDLHKAARFGQLAVQKNPNHAPFRVTLGSVYLDAGLFLRARSELEQAAKLDPSNAQIKELLARARKMSS